jgi:threonine dehydrogenase-like Zn-dependent dehydrogenase
MRILTYEGVPRPGWREAPDLRVAGAAEAIVRPIAATTCDLDRAILAGRTPLPPPFALGHECVAEVIEVGDGVMQTRPGQVVVVPWHIACGACPMCRRGLTASCESVTPRAMYGTPIGGDWGGLFSDLVRVPYADAMLVPVPDGVPPSSVASASDNLTDAWLAVSRPLATRRGAPVLVVGGNGSIALYAVQAALAAGAGAVDYVDRDAARLELAASFGARAIPRGAPLGEYPVVIDASGNSAELARALRAVAPGGACHSVGIYFLDVAVPFLDMYAKDVTFTTGRPSVGPHIAPVLALVAEGKLHPEKVGQVAAWEDMIDVLASRPLKPILCRERLL